MKDDSKETQDANVPLTKVFAKMVTNKYHPALYKTPLAKATIIVVVRD